ncbi:MAG: hypothetical protein WBJ59_06920 [Dysgonamonadaceae bacterium]
MSGKERQTVLFADTGVVAPTDTVERVPLTDGMVFVAQRIEVRPSLKYGSYVVFDGEDLDGKEFHGYSTSSVILQQAKALLERYGGEDGNLTHDILCAVKSVVSESTGRRFYTLA